ncbi:hypothetical protein [Marinobacter nauticus]|uniref:hypothetical protein n=1 Tax=Marinobacter nauticus TaxID=2743 RepID=UPI003735C73D
MTQQNTVNQQKPWMPLKDVYDHFGYGNQKSALNAINKGSFPVETFRVGRIRAIHRDVYNAYFAQFREEGLDRVNRSK